MSFTIDRGRTPTTWQAAILLSWIALATPVAIAYDLGRHEWQDRLLVYAAASAEDSQLASLRDRIAAQRDAIVERHLRVFELLPDRGSVDGEPLSADDVRSLREQFAIAGDDAVMLLVGKDGGVKDRAALDAPLERFFVLIDGMPMRQREMRLQQRGRDAYR